MSKQHPMLLISVSVILTVISIATSIFIALLPMLTDGRASRAEVLPAQIIAGIFFMFSGLLLVGSITLRTSKTTQGTDGHL